MIEASVMRTVGNDDKISYEVKAKGHAGAGKYGQDIVCAAVSVLMQTLANEVEEAARVGTVVLGAVAHGDGWMKVEVTPTRESCNMVEAWVELVQDGLDALAESYPENVELVVNVRFADGKAPDPAQLPDMVSGKMNLQLFAEGGDGGTPAQAAADGSSTDPKAESSATEGSGSEDGADKGEGEAGEEAKKPSPAERRKAFGQMMSGVLDTRYYLHMRQPSTGETRLLVYDTERQLWHEEDVAGDSEAEGWAMCSTGRQLYQWDGASLWATEPNREADRDTDEAKAALEKNVAFDAVTGDIGLNTPADKYVSRVTLRVDALSYSVVKLQASYDGGAWETLGEAAVLNKYTRVNLPFGPTRHDTMRLRLTGTGQIAVRSVAFTMADSRGNRVAGGEPRN